MGILDNVRGRLGLGGQRDASYDADYDAYGSTDESAYEQADYDDYNDYGDYGDYDERGRAFDANGGSDYEAEGAWDDQPAAMRSFGVDRADYYNDNHPPLVSQADVRAYRPEPGRVPTRVPARAAARVPSQVPERQRDRIFEPRAYRRATNTYEGKGLDEDALAFKDGLARGEVHSFSELQAERLRLEDTGRFARVAALHTSAPASAYHGRTGGVGGASGASGASGTGDAGGADPVIISGQVRPRGRRRVERIRPLGYAEAEQVTRLLKSGVVVLVDLSQTRPELAKRILDFSFGVVSALDGQVDRYADRVYVFTAKTALTAEERASIRLEL
jgi:cell division inhibitor SepF